MPSGKYDRLTGEEPPMPAGAVIHGIRRIGSKFAVVKVTQLLTRQKEWVVQRDMSEQDAERLARELQERYRKRHP